MAININQLKDLDIERLKETVIQYSVALDTANESILKLQNNTELNDSPKNLTKNQNKEFASLKKEMITIKDQLKSLNELNILLTSQNEDSVNKINLLQKVIEEKDSEINLIMTKNKEVKYLQLKNNGIIHTYNIKGYDNRTGLEINGGATYIKAVIIVKLVNDVLFWEIRSHDLDLNINRSLNLIEYKNGSNLQERSRITSLEIRTKGVGSYLAIKEFLQIPEIVENGFNKNTMLISGG